MKENIFNKKENLKITISPPGYILKKHNDIQTYQCHLLGVVVGIVGGIVIF